MRNSFPMTPILLSLALVFVVGCSAPTSPVDELQAQLKTAPEYSIILEDMREEGTFFPAYYHKYKVIQGDQTWSTDLRQVSEEFYRRNENFLGMTLASKIEGEKSTTPHPAGYNYVGNEKYGQWKSDNRGNSFWEFYGKYALMRDLFGSPDEVSFATITINTEAIGPKIGPTTVEPAENTAPMARSPGSATRLFLSGVEREMWPASNAFVKSSRAESGAAVATPCAHAALDLASRQ